MKISFYPPIRPPVFKTAYAQDRITNKMTKTIIMFALLCSPLCAQTLTYALSGQFTTTQSRNTLDPEPLGMTVGDVTDYTFTINLDPSAGFLGIRPAALPGNFGYNHDIYGYSRDAILGATLTTGTGVTLNFAPSVFFEIGPTVSGSNPLIVSNTDLLLGQPTRWNFFIGTTPGGNATWDFEQLRVSQFNEFASDGRSMLPSSSKFEFGYARYIEGFAYVPGENSPSPQGSVWGNSFNASPVPIPEPASMLLVTLGSLILLHRRHRDC